jgi:methyl-accepting chemotaxis protein
VAEVSTTVEEINQTSKSASDNAQQVVRVAEEAVEGGRAGQNAINKAVAVMQSIHDQVKGVTEQIMRLNERNEQIVNIVESVNELAEQSNLLAVNASIEAAKAGEHGRGFSVVASEVRDLAKQSKAATQQIRSLLSEIEKESGRAVTGTNEALERTKAGQSEIESVREVLQSLASVLDLTADKARQIFGSTAQQAAGIEQISDAMENVAQGGEDSASGARQLEEAVHGLSLLAKQLNRTIHGSAKDE